MREIKFRVWNTETNKMIINVKEMGVFALKSIYTIDEFLVIPTDEKYPLMQYTGLKDKNGVEIYEGDILSNAIGDLFTIYFDKGCFFIHPIWKESDEFDIALYFCKNIPSVIGNIYENKELLN